MYIIGKEYIFRIRNKSSNKGYSIYTGTVVDTSANKIFILTIKNEDISIDLEDILGTFSKA